MSESETESKQVTLELYRQAIKEVEEELVLTERRVYGLKRDLEWLKGQIGDEITN